MHLIELDVMGKFIHVLMNYRMKKFVIYTIMVGGYDDILQPLVIDDRFDYVLFSNDFVDAKIGVWQVRPIPLPYGIKANDYKRLSRYPKSHPEEMLAGYEASLYLDANIQIVDQWVYDKCVEYAERRVQLATVHLSTIPHPFAPAARDDIYEHAYDMCSTLIEHDFDVIVQCHRLYKLGFQRHYGLNENNLIFRMHTELMKKCDEEWWWWIANYSFRDQFSYMYCLWKYHIQAEYFFPYGITVRNTPHFKYIWHTGLSSNNRRTLKGSLGERIRVKCKNISSRKYNRYCLHWLFLMKLPYPVFALNIWTLLVGLINSPVLVYGCIKRKIIKRK